MKSIIFDSLIFAYIFMVAFIYAYLGPFVVRGDEDQWVGLLPMIGLSLILFLILGAGLNLLLKRGRLYTLGALLFEAEHIKANRIPTPLLGLARMRSHNQILHNILP